MTPPPPPPPPPPPARLLTTPARAASHDKTRAVTRNGHAARGKPHRSTHGNGAHVASSGSAVAPRLAGPRGDLAAAPEPAARPSPFRDRMPLGEFLFAYLHHLGVEHCFGVPGDFALPTFAWLDKSPIEAITMTHEPSAGFAADAYARLRGLGLVAVTYCVGGLNVLNAIAGAYAEKSPVVVISGAPGRKDREKDMLLHHKVKTFDTQRKVYEEVTVATAVLLEEERAAEEIVRCVSACLRHKRPVYIEVPHDMVDREIPVHLPTVKPPPPSDEGALEACVEEAARMIKAAKQPVLLAGVELHRHDLTDLAIGLAEKLNIPIASDLLSKSAVAENHPLYLGVYSGAMSSDQAVRDFVESSDCVLMLGSFVTDMNLGFFTARLERKRTILATTEAIDISYHRYHDVRLDDFLKGLSAAGIPPKKLRKPKAPPAFKPLDKSELTDKLDMTEVIRIISLHLDEKCCVVSDVGDAIFGAVGIRTRNRAEFIAPAYYLSMGFAVPAGIGVCKADPTLRPFVLVGDGAFQMTGTELSTAVRLGLKPIVLILNNDGYGTMRKIRDGRFNVISNWNYTKICELVGGGDYAIASTKGELDGAIRSALASDDGPRVIEVRVPRHCVSPQLENMTTEMAKARGGRKA
ncbi:MAG: alpha-keto acid decarboxylase family protein [Tepidisphaerales bacterium]